MIMLLATIRVVPGAGPQYETAVAEIMPRIRAANPGILFYNAGRCREEADTYRVVEVYVDQDVMHRHIGSAELQDAFAEPYHSEITLTGEAPLLWIAPVAASKWPLSKERT